MVWSGCKRRAASSRRAFTRPQNSARGSRRKRQQAIAFSITASQRGNSSLALREDYTEETRCDNNTHSKNLCDICFHIGSIWKCPPLRSIGELVSHLSKHLRKFCVESPTF